MPDDGNSRAQGSVRTLPSVVYSAAIDDLSNALFYGKQHVDYPSLRSQYVPELAKIAEALLISPRVVLKVRPRSLTLPILLDYFQPETVLELLDEGALEFIVWTHAVGSLGSVVMGMPAPNPTERDAGAIAERDLAMCFPKLDHAVRDRIISEFVKRTTATTGEGAEDAINVAMEFAGLGVFGDRVPGKDAFINAPADITAAARGVAEDLYETSVVLSNEYDFFETDGTWRAFERVSNDIARRANLTDGLEKLYREAAVPSARALLLDGVISPTEIGRIRRDRATSEFRRWLWKADDVDDTPAVAAAYLNAMRKGLDSDDWTFRRTARIATFSVLSDLANHAVALGASAAFGQTVSPLPDAAGAAGGVAFDLITRYAERYFRKPDPRRYVEMLRERSGQGES